MDIQNGENTDYLEALAKYVKAKSHKTSSN